MCHTFTQIEGSLKVSRKRYLMEEYKGYRDFSKLEMVFPRADASVEIRLAGPRSPGRTWSVGRLLRLLIRRTFASKPSCLADKLQGLYPHFLYVYIRSRANGTNELKSTYTEQGARLPMF